MAGLWTAVESADELDRLFESPLTELARTSQLLSGWAPALDVHEDKDNFIVNAELPGMKKEDIDVSLHDGSAEHFRRTQERRRKRKMPKCAVQERFFGKFQRAVTLPAPVAADKVKAQYKDGILTITLPKTEEAKPKQIDVSVN